VSLRRPEPATATAAIVSSGSAAAAAPRFAPDGATIARGVRDGVVAGLIVGLAGFLVFFAIAYLAPGTVAADPVLLAEGHANGASDPTAYAVGETMAAGVHQLWLGPALGAVGGVLGGLFARGRG
jgi:hypothetical protein